MTKPVPALAILCASLTFSALAQTAPHASAPKNSAPAPVAGQPTSSTEASPVEPEPEDENTPTEPVLYITSVEAMRSTHGPPLDVIRVRGLSSTEGWQSGELLPLGRGPAPDDVLDLVFVAHAPTNSAGTTGFSNIEAVFTVEPGHPYKGIRVHSATNRITLKAIPGYAEAPPPPNDCSNCAGKRFVGKGEPLPLGMKEADVIHEENLPRHLHVVRESEGIGKFDSEANRLTLVLNEDGTIVLAIWD